MAWDREKDRKMGRGMAIVSNLFGLGFMAVWVYFALSSGAWFMAVFAIPMVGMLVYRLYLSFRMGRSEKKQDPWDRPAEPRDRVGASGHAAGYCPYCGGAVQEEFSFCPICGRSLE